jgi:hypothetical protein
MRIVTLGQVAGIGGGDDHIYEGNAYLLRFSIDSPERFFAVQLPFIVNTLGIDPRQIMRLEIVCSGWQQAMICISFEDAVCDAERLESAINKVCAAPSACKSASTCGCRTHGVGQDERRDWLHQTRTHSVGVGSKEDQHGAEEAMGKNEKSSRD